MTQVIQATDVNDALIKGLGWLREAGQRESSRNGPVVKAPSFVVTVTLNPERRVLHLPWRDANPFFHLYEAIWMMAGRQDVAPLARYVSRMKDYSDDGVVFNAAYGRRWRGPDHLGLGVDDQIAAIIRLLRADPTTRQCVLQIWSRNLDLGTTTRDHACNVAATFQVDQSSERLDMVVFCRSNDAIWGAHGANAVHMSFLLEYVATAIGRRVGRMTQISVNYHAYEDVFAKTTDSWSGEIPSQSPYWVGHGFDADQPHYPIMSTPPEVWDRDAAKFLTHDGTAPSSFIVFDDPFFQEVALPIVRAHDMWKEHRDADLVMRNLEHCRAADWRSACEQWIKRRVRDLRS